MLKRTSIYLDTESLKALERIGKRKGNLKAAQMVRIAVNEYIAREEKSKR
jgi:metal-responsive CopG/Arc/MetJ family transcriptional regulator